MEIKNIKNTNFLKTKIINKKIQRTPRNIDKFYTFVHNITMILGKKIIQNKTKMVQNSRMEGTIDN